MPIILTILRKTREPIEIYWVLARIMVPITLVTEIASRMGIIEAVSPVFAPVMAVIGLPTELGLAWVTTMLVGIWGAVPLLFTLVPISTLSTADVTIFSALILFAHGLPVEQKIIQSAGPGMIATTALRIAGGLLYAFILHQIFSATGWLSEPVAPAWIPLAATPDWPAFLLGFAETMSWMFVVLVALYWFLEILKLTGILATMMAALSPLLRLAGIRGEAGYLTAVGLFLGISYGAGLLIREAQSGNIPPRQIFISCVFMGFAHSIIEDTLLVMALGADISGVLVGRLLFAIVATAGIATLLSRLNDRIFFQHMYRLNALKAGQPV